MGIWRGFMALSVGMLCSAVAVPLAPGLAEGSPGGSAAPARGQQCTYSYESGGVQAFRRPGHQPRLRITQAAKTPRRLTMVDLCLGHGKTVTGRDVVKVRYIAAGYRSRRVLDSSYGQGAVVLPLTGVIRGWRHGVPGMRPGGVRLLLVPARLAYGHRGVPPAIGRDEALAFVVDLRRHIDVQSRARLAPSALTSTGPVHGAP